MSTTHKLHVRDLGLDERSTKFSLADSVGDLVKDLTIDELKALHERIGVIIGYYDPDFSVGGT